MASVEVKVAGMASWN